MRSAFVLPLLASAAMLTGGTAQAQPDTAVAETAQSQPRDCLPVTVSAFMRAYRAWGAAPTVEAYMNLFTSDATLMDSGLTEPIGLPAIRSQIENVLKVFPDYRFDPFEVTATSDGRVAFVRARNTGTIKGQPVDFVTMHRLVLSGDRVAQGRRFWDQTEMFRPVAPDLPNLFDGVAGTADPTPRTTPVTERQQAWNTENTGALVAGLPDSVQLTGPGLTAPLTGRAAAASYLDRLFGAVEKLDLRPAHRVWQNGVGYQEWVGTAVVGRDQPRTIQFGIVENLVNAPGSAARWTLHFDTLDMVATPARIAELRKLIFTG